jgi:hypothetical protein
MSMDVCRSQDENKAAREEMRRRVLTVPQPVYDTGNAQDGYCEGRRYRRILQKGRDVLKSFQFIHDNLHRPAH